MYKCFLKNHLVRFILSLNLPDDDYIFAGSSALFVHQIVQRQMGDLDIVAKGEAWTELRRHGILQNRTETESNFKGPHLKLKGKNLEVFRFWIDEEAEKVMSQTRIIHVTYQGGKRSLHILSIEKVKEYKRRLGRSKDMTDLTAIANWERTHPEEARKW